MSRDVPRSAATALIALVVAILPAWLPRAGQGQAPAAPGDLLKSEPFDQITLIDGTVLKVEPISPRPLPEYDAKADRLRRQREAQITARQGNVTIKGNRAELATEKKDPASPSVEITIKPIGEENVYRVRRGSIKSITYFEDMLLSAAEQLVRRKDFARAFEHYLLVKERAGTWKGLEEGVDALLYEEGADALRENRVERGLRLLRELHERRPDYPGLADQLARAYGGRIEQLLKDGAYADGRRVLHELEGLAPDHLIVRDLRGRYIAQARARADRAEQAPDPASRVDNLAAALRIWPDLEGAADRYREAFAALPTLEVAVADLPRPLGPWVRTPADARATRLLYLPLLAAEDEEAAQGQRTDQLASGVESSDIGRRVTIRLREGPSWNDQSGPVSSIDVVRSLTERAQPESPGYQARWAHLLQRIDATDGRQVVVELLRTPLKPGAWFVSPIGPAHAGRDGQVPGPDGSRRPVGDGPFEVGPRSAASIAYQAVESGQAAPPRIRRVVERRITDGAAAVSALKSGEVSLIEHVAPDQVAELGQEPELKLGRYAHPRLHMLALDGRSPALRNRTLRRALAYALDRKAILEENVLRRPIDETNRLCDGAFPADSYARAPGVRPLEPDPLLARMLVAAAKKELGEDRLVASRKGTGDKVTLTLRLTLEYPDVPAAQAAVPRIVEGLEAAGLEIEAIARPESELEGALRDGRRFDLAYRIATCPEPITDVGPLLCPGYDAPPSADGLAAVASPRILQLLLQLESASEFPTARGLVIQIDREVRDELPVIPLWQLDDHYAWRSRLKGPAGSAEYLYQGIDAWEIEPWFARDPW
jgi:peptide/nickel transport system substrate-binding protein